MSQDVATLGLSVDSSQVTTATSALDKFAASAKPAAGAVDNLTNSSGKATLAQKALAAATTGVSGQLIALSAGAGPVGVFLSALGPWGLAASVALGALGAAFAYVTSESARMGEKAIAVRAFSVATELTVAQIAALRKAGAEFGAGGDGLQTAFERLTVGLVDARRATGALYDDVQKVDGGLAKQLETANSTKEGIDILAKAYNAATDASTKLRLARAIFGRGGAEYAPILGKVDDAAGLDSLVAKTKNLGVQADDTNDRWARMSSQITETEKRTKNIIAGTFTEEGLSAALAYAQYLERMAVAAAKLAESRSGLTTSQSFISRMAEADPDFAVAAHANKLTQTDLDAKLRLSQETIAGWGRFEQSLAAVTPAAERASSSFSTVAKATREMQDAAAAAAKTQQDVMSFLGSGATIADRLTQRLKDIAAIYADNRTGAATASEALLLKVRAEQAANLDAVIQKEGARIGVLGTLQPMGKS